MKTCKDYGHKVGDQFEVIAEGSIFSIGSIVELEHDDNTHSPMFKLIRGYCHYNNANDGKPGAYINLERVRKINTTNNGVKETVTKSWSFNISSPEAIDFFEIRQDLTRDNPMAKVEFKSEKGDRKHYVVIHESLIDKATTLQIPDPVGNFYDPYVELTAPSDYALWTGWARRVISAKWNGEKGVVTVSSLKVRL